MGRYETWYVEEAPRPPRTCRTCGEPCTGRRSTYCSASCDDLYHERVFRPLSSHHVADQALRRDDFRCQACGARPVVEIYKHGGHRIRSSTWEGGNGVYLEVDHIVPVADDPGQEFDLDNLRVLCRRCHGRHGARPQGTRYRAAHHQAQQILAVTGGPP